MVKKYIQILRKLKPGKFKELPRKSRLECVENLEQMRENLWSMFKLRYTKEQLREFNETHKWPFGSNVADYAWTGEVKEAFYNHPYHKKLVGKLKRRGDLTWGMWVLNTEPTDYEDNRTLYVPRRSNINSLMKSVGEAFSEGEIDAVWDFENEQPMSLRAEDSSFPRFVVSYINAMLTRGEGITLTEMKKDAAGLLRSLQEDLYNMEYKLKA